MELLGKFSTSPDVMAQAGNNLQGVFQQNQESASKLMQSSAFAQLAQGMLKNYSDFMMELGQAGMSAMTQAQSTMVSQTKQATDNVVEASKRTR